MEYFSEDTKLFKNHILFSRICQEKGKIVYYKKWIIVDKNHPKPIITNLRWDMLRGVVCEKRNGKWFQGVWEIDDPIYIKNLDIFLRKLKLEKLLKS